MPGCFSNSHIFTAERYTVIHAPTGAMKPKSPSGFDELSDQFKEETGTYAGQDPASCDREITV